jgi:hypothetical protein
VAARPAAAGEPNRHALLIGCTEYPELRKQHGETLYEQSIRLHGPANDVELFRELLAEQFQFRPGSIATLVGWDEGNVGSRPTRANIERSFRDLAEKAAAGDIVVILIAGHGSYQPVPEGPARSDNPEPDGRDEIFLPADVVGWLSEDGKVQNAILDDEIGSWLGAIRKKGAFVWIIFDVCHSGTMTRGGLGEVVRDRYLEPRLLGVPVARAAPSLRTRGMGGGATEYDLLDLGSGNGGWVALYATQPYERAPEMPLPLGASEANARYHGLLTYTVSQTLRQSKTPLSYRELLQRVLAFYQTIPWTVPTPFAEGEAERELLGLQSWPQRSLIRLHKLGERLTVTAGALMGLTPGSILAVYPPAGSQDADRLLGHVQIERTGATTSDVKPVELERINAPPPTSLPEGSRCDVVVYDHGDWRVRLALVVSRKGGAPSSGLLPDELPPDLGATIASLVSRTGSFLELTPDLASAHWLLYVENGNAWLARGGWEPARPIEEQALGPFDVRAAAPFAAEMEALLRRVYRWQNLRRLAGSGADPGRSDISDLGLTVDLRSCDPSFVDCRSVAPGAPLEVGQRVEARIRNSGSRPLDVTLLLLDSGFGIAALFPTEGRYNRLGKGEEAAIKMKIAGDTLGTEHLVAFAVPTGVRSELTDFTWLAQPTLAPPLRTRGGQAPSPLEQVLAVAIFSAPRTRSAQLLASEPDARPALHLITWETMAASAIAPRR